MRLPACGLGGRAFDPMYLERVSSVGLGRLVLGGHGIVEEP